MFNQARNATEGPIRWLWLWPSVACLLSACDPPPVPQRPAFSHRASRLFDGVDQMRPGSIVLDPAGNGWAAVHTSASPGQEWVVTDRGTTATYDQIDRASIRYTAAGGLVFRARRQDKVYVVWNLREGEPYDEVGNVVFDGEGRPGFHAMIRGGFYAVLGGRRVGPFDRFAMPSPVFSPTGARFALQVVEGNRYIVMVDGQRTGPWDEVLSMPRFSPDGRHYAFAAVSNAAHVVVANGRILGTFEAIRDGSPVYGPRLGRLAYGAQDDKDWWAVVDGRPHGPYETLEDAFFFDLSGQRVAFKAMRSDKTVLIVDGVELGQYDAVEPGTPIFSADGKHWAGCVRDGDSWFVLRDGTPGNPYDVVVAESLRFSPDGRRLGFTAGRNGRWHVVIDGKESPPYDGVLEGFPIFSPDSARTAWCVRRDGRSIVVVDRREGRAYRALGEAFFRFSGNSKRYAFWAITGPDAGHAVIDGIEGSSYAGIHLSGFVFSGDSRHAGYVATTQTHSVVVVDGSEVAKPDALLPGSGLRPVGDQGYQYWAVRTNSAFLEQIYPRPARTGARRDRPQESNGGRSVTVGRRSRISGRA